MQGAVASGMLPNQQATHEDKSCEGSTHSNMQPKAESRYLPWIVRSCEFQCAGQLLASVAPAPSTTPWGDFSDAAIAVPLAIGLLAKIIFTHVACARQTTKRSHRSPTVFAVLARHLEQEANKQRGLQRHTSHWGNPDITCEFLRLFGSNKQHLTRLS